MNTDPSNLAERNRASALSGVLVAVAAAVGAECAITASVAIETAGGSTKAAIRVVLPPKPLLSLAAAGLASGALAIVLVMLRRPSPLFGCSSLLSFVISRPVESPAFALVRRRLGISHRSGGLYGP